MSERKTKAGKLDGCLKFEKCFYMFQTSSISQINHVCVPKTLGARLPGYLAEIMLINNMRPNYTIAGVTNTINNCPALIFGIPIYLVTGITNKFEIFRFLILWNKNVLAVNQ